MPAVIELLLQPERPCEPTTRQLHGLACELFERTRPGRDGGHAAQDKPFTVWPLRQADGGLLFRGAWLPPGFPQHILAATSPLRLGHVACDITDIAFQPATHDELADVPEVDGIRLTLLSPAYFSQSGRYLTEPDPRLIAGSWRRRWNSSLPAGHPLAIGNELWRDIHLALHITGSGLRTETRDTGYRLHGPVNRQQPGLTGTATLRLESAASAAVRQAFATLARFAEYCGTGAQVTHGFGATTTTLLHSSWSPSLRS